MGSSVMGSYKVVVSDNNIRIENGYLLRGRSFGFIYLAKLANRLLAIKRTSNSGFSCICLSSSAVIVQTDK